MIHINESLTPKDQFKLLSSSDVFISLHRSEGYGLVIAEALALGKPVVATKYSGADDFKDHPQFHGVSYRLVPVAGDPVYSTAAESDEWADPDLEEATNFLKTLYGSRPTTSNKTVSLG
ncbi:hypothetical protein GCM10022278_15390 [Allohahella marinimesophila]|uniref:Glycosyl transferase family 1 domain-containing protein n=1 Tax=Allohahella marinimesophila TaxID=1054972 RepID=A0ABP7P0S0_9GAMM